MIDIALWILICICVVIGFIVLGALAIEWLMHAIMRFIGYPTVK